MTFSKLFKYIWWFSLSGAGVYMLHTRYDRLGSSERLGAFDTVLLAIVGALLLLLLFGEMLFEEQAFGAWYNMDVLFIPFLKKVGVLMQFVIGIVPPDDYKQKIISFRNNWDSNGLREVIEPHITVKAQSGLTEDLAWLHKVKTACSSFPSFQVSLAEPASYGTAVTFLSVESEDIFKLHKHLMEVVSPSAESVLTYELDGFHPHLTLGQTRWGMGEAEIAEMEQSARTALAPFPTFKVAFVRVYKEIEPNKYVSFDDIQLA